MSDPAVIGSDHPSRQRVDARAGGQLGLSHIRSASIRPIEHTRTAAFWQSGSSVIKARSWQQFFLRSVQDFAKRCRTPIWPLARLRSASCPPPATTTKRFTLPLR